MPPVDLPSPAPGQTVLTGLIGRDIQASRSPWMHEREGAAQGLSLTYTLFDFVLSGRTEGDLGLALSEAEAGGYSGVNVTHPYKQAVIAHLDDLAPSAARIGAVNTVLVKDGKTIGTNTDVAGFYENIKPHLRDTRKAVVLGAGEAARMLLAGIHQRGWVVLGLLTTTPPSSARALPACRCWARWSRCATRASSALPPTWWWPCLAPRQRSAAARCNWLATPACPC